MTLDALSSQAKIRSRDFVIFFGLFKFPGGNSIENKLSERLDLFKHQHTLKIKHLQVKINSMLGEALKIQDYKFEYLCNGWRKIFLLYKLAQYIVSSLKSYPRVGIYSFYQLNEFFKKLYVEIYHPILKK